MSILIKGMDMPIDCAVCPCCVDVGQGDETEYFCSADDCAPDIQDITAGRLQTCTLVEIPTPHGRLIDADALSKALWERWNVDDDQDFANKSVWRELENVLTIIEAEGES